MLTVVTNSEAAPAGSVDGGSFIDEIVREGARRMLAAALEAEVAAYIAAHVGELDERAGGWWCATVTPRRAGC